VGGAEDVAAVAALAAVARHVALALPAVHTLAAPAEHVYTHTHT
jgi:hypothetical protein